MWALMESRLCLIHAPKFFGLVTRVTRCVLNLPHVRVLCSDLHHAPHRPGYRCVTIPTPFGPDTLWVKLPEDSPKSRHHPPPAAKPPPRVGQLTEPLLYAEAADGNTARSSPYLL